MYKTATLMFCSSRINLFYVNKYILSKMLLVNYNISNEYVGHNFSSDTTPKNEVIRSGLKFG